MKIKNVERNNKEEEEGGKEGKYRKGKGAMQEGLEEGETRERWVVEGERRGKEAREGDDDVERGRVDPRMREKRKQERKGARRGKGFR